MIIRKLGIMNLFLVITLFSISTSSGQEFKSLIDKTYNFNPAKINDEERAKITSELDSIWNLVQSDTSKYLVELRHELNDTNHQSFFYFDGSSLLLSLSQSTPDLEIISRALLRCELGGVTHFEYLRMALALSYYKINVLGIAKKILEMEEFKPYIEQHDMYWDKDICLVWLLYELDDKMYINDIIPIFDKVNNDSKMAILSYLFYSCTCEGDTFIKECSKNKSIDNRIQEHALILTEMMCEKSNNDSDKYKELIAERKKLLSRISDEVLTKFINQTKEIRKVYTCD